MVPCSTSGIEKAVFQVFLPYKYFMEAMAIPEGVNPHAEANV